MIFAFALLTRPAFHIPGTNKLYHQTRLLCLACDIRETDGPALVAECEQPRLCQRSLKVYSRCLAASPAQSSAAERKTWWSVLMLLCRTRPDKPLRPAQGSEGRKGPAPNTIISSFLVLVLAVPAPSCYPDPSVFRFLPPGAG